jgi:hypothetical protein
MAIDVATLLNDRINMRKIEWEDKFNETMLAFSDKVAKSISQKVFLKIENSLNDSFKEMPTKEKPLQYAFSFEIVNPNTAKELKEMAGSASELAPFKEWFERFTVVGQKIARDGNDSFAISSSVISKMAPQGVREKGIDGLYFNEIMSLVGQTVERKLNALIKEETSKPENEELKITAVWVRRQEQLSSTASNLRDNSINVIGGRPNIRVTSRHLGLIKLSGFLNLINHIIF